MCICIYIYMYIYIYKIEMYLWQSHIIIILVIMILVTVVLGLQYFLQSANWGQSQHTYMLVDWKPIWTYILLQQKNMGGKLLSITTSGVASYISGVMFYCFIWKATYGFIANQDYVCATPYFGFVRNHNIVCAIGLL